MIHNYLLSKQTARQLLTLLGISNLFPKFHLTFISQTTFKNYKKTFSQAGSFGGTYFRPIYSSVTKQKYGPEVWKELPQDWLEGLNIKIQVKNKLTLNCLEAITQPCKN